MIGRKLNTYMKGVCNTKMVCDLTHNKPMMIFYNMNKASVKTFWQVFHKPKHNLHISNDVTLKLMVRILKGLSI